MIIFGWGGGTPRDQGAVAPARCPRCNNTQVFRYMVSRKWFRLYFVPLIPFDTKHLLVCPVCTMATQLDRQQVDRVKQMSAITGQWSARALNEHSYTSAVEAFWGNRPLPHPDLLAAGGALPGPAAPAQPATPPEATAAAAVDSAPAAESATPFDGRTYQLRKHPDAYLVVRRSDGQVLQRFPANEDGYVTAWRSFRALEDTDTSGSAVG